MPLLPIFDEEFSSREIDTFSLGPINTGNDFFYFVL